MTDDCKSLLEPFKIYGQKCSRSLKDCINLQYLVEHLFSLMQEQ